MRAHNSALFLLLDRLTKRYKIVSNQGIYMHKQILYLDVRSISYIIKSEYTDHELYEIGFKGSDRILQFDPSNFDWFITKIAEELRGYPIKDDGK